MLGNEPEEVRKVSIGTHADTSFDFSTYEDGGDGVSTSWSPIPSSVTFTGVRDCYVYGQAVQFHDLRFSNSLTVEHNVLGGGVFDHILRHRTTSPTTFAATDRWFHYDQVGSIISESNASGALAQAHHQDAFGNIQAAWNTGLWGGDTAGWHHNTKELDGDTGLVYMYQRWYGPETGTFMSSARFTPYQEQRFNFAIQNPVRIGDPRGKFPIDFLPFLPLGDPLRDMGERTFPAPKNPYINSGRDSNIWAGAQMRDRGAPRLAATTVGITHEYLIQPPLNGITILLYNVPSNAGIRSIDILEVNYGWDEQDKRWKARDKNVEDRIKTLTPIVPLSARR